MKILFDHQVFIWHKRGGVSRYFAELMKQIATMKDVSYELPLINNQNIHLAENGIKNSFFNRLASHSFIADSKLKQYLDYTDTYNVIRTLKKQQFDVFVPTLYETYFLPYIGNKPFVITIHDMIHELFPEYFGETDLYLKQKKELIKKASKIAVVSENTKTDLLRVYPETNADKIYITGTNHAVKPYTSDVGHKLPSRYILFVGERGGYKNFNFFIKSMSKILAADKELFVLCMGGSAFSKEEITLFQQLTIQKQVVHYIAAEKELYTIYNKALVFVFPSLYEGFGLPTLEAMTSQCPVVLTDIAVFREVAQDAAVYFDSNNSDELEHAVRELIYYNTNKEILIKKGLENVKRYTWEEIAKRCVHLYQTAME
ncbi:MAG: glycosyltransferase family 4 protein [Sphingobacteriales bacterium]|nr:glycosyltransferase family 4 protein [Sphingobacteriales bacterium]